MGIPVCQYAFDLLGAQGVRRIAVNLHHLPAEARKGIERLDRGGARLLFSDETDLLLGSAGGMAKASRLLGEVPFFVLNADRLARIDLGALAKRHRKLRGAHGVSVTLVFRRGGAGAKYREFTLNGSGELVLKGGELAENALYYAGAAVVEPEAVRELPQGRELDFYNDVLVPLMGHGKVGAMVSEGLWIDVDSPLLWMEAHFEAMRAAETGDLPPEWSRRIATHNERVSLGCWRLKGSGATPRGWKEPCYWGREDRPPDALGPRAVVYSGVNPPAGGFANGIGAAGEWVPVPAP